MVCFSKSSIIFRIFSWSIFGSPQKNVISCWLLCHLFSICSKKTHPDEFLPIQSGMSAPLSVGSRRVVGLLDLGLVGHDGKPRKAMEQPAVLVGKTSMPAHSLWPLWFFPIKGTLKWPSQRPFFWVYVTYTWLLKDVTENVLVAGHFNSEITAG